MLRETLRGGAAAGLACAVMATTQADPGRFEFELREEIECGVRPQVVAVLDIDGDQVMDLVAAGFDPTPPIGSRVRILRGDGFGGFAEAVEGPDLVIAQPERWLPFHADDDGCVDVLAGSGGLWLLLNDGDGGFEQPVRLTPFDPFLGAPVLVDLNGDERLDVVAVDERIDRGAELYVWLTVGDGTFEVQPSVPLATVPERYLLHAGDFDGDERGDVVLAPLETRGDGTSSTEPVRALFGDGDGTFTEDGTPPTGDGPSPWLVAADVNADGRTDLVDGRNTYLGRADRAFDTLADASTARANSVHFAAQLDGDPHLDLVTTSGFLCGHGDGTFGDPTPLPALGNLDRPMALEDVTGDGLPDFVAASPIRTDITLVRQVGLDPPTVAGGAIELTDHGRQTLRLTGSGFRNGLDVVSLGDLIVHGVVVESETVVLVDVEVPPRIGVAVQSLMVRNPDARSDRVDLPVRGLSVTSARGKLVDHAAPGRDRISLRAEIAFTGLSARGEFADVRQGVRLEIGDADDPYVIDLPAGDPRWRMYGPTVPARFVYRSAKGEFPRLKVVVDTARGRLKVKARDLDLPGDPGAEVLLRAVIVGEPAEDSQTFVVRDRSRGPKRVIRRR